jgi:hypothetical protein
MIEPNLLCDKHLLGEHNELHKFHPSFVKKHSIKGRIFPVVQIEPSNMKIRHDALAEEMISRNFNHNSPYEMPDLSYLTHYELAAKVDMNASYQDLISRCNECKKINENLKLR